MLEGGCLLGTLGIHSHQVDDLAHRRTSSGTTAQTEGLQGRGQEEIIVGALDAICQNG